MQKQFCVSVYVLNPINRKFLFIKHKKLGKWIQPGGHIDLNEDPEEAALRETFEETGIRVELIGDRKPRPDDFIQPLAIQKNRVSESHLHMDFVYLAYPLPNQTESINKKETDGVGWFSLEEILDETFDTFEEVKTWCKRLVELSTV